jgi:hypothetical protein
LPNVKSIYKMEAELKFLKDFYIKKKQYKAGSSINIEVDADMIPFDSAWYEQLRFEENKSYFELKSLTQVKKINK